ncbi:hypothetical protein VdG2_05416 [Verticillium dahliae VDG2]|nr:hypothetical protein VdG2_05416 [Verticillium dahliae VDG2]
MIELSNDTVTRQMSEDIIAAASTSSTPSWPNAHCIVNTTQLSVLHKGVPHGIANAAGQLSMSDLLNRRFTARDRFCHRRKHDCLAVQHLLPAPPSPAGQVPGRTVEKSILVSDAARLPHAQEDR